jgi:hypothetical protein
LVERDAPKYLGVDTLTRSDRETAGGSRQGDRQWSTERKGRQPDDCSAEPAGTAAQRARSPRKRAAVVIKMNQAAAEIYNQATAALKTQNVSLAKRIFQQVYDQTMPGDQYRDMAVKQLELLK